MTRLGKASAYLASRRRLRHPDVDQWSANRFRRLGGCLFSCLTRAALFKYGLMLSRETLADERAAVPIVSARKAATTVKQAIAPLKPTVVGYLTVRRAGAAVSAPQPAEYHARTQRDDPGAAAERSTALAGSVDLSGLAPFLSPVMFV
jgi:hypothetical protein